MFKISITEGLLSYNIQTSPFSGIMGYSVQYCLLVCNDEYSKLNNMNNE